MKQQIVSFEDDEFVIQQLPADQAIAVGITISKIVSGASAGFGELYSDDILDTPINPAMIISGVISKLDAKETPAFIRKLVMDSLVKPDEFTADQYNARFAGKLDDLFVLVEEIIKLNNYVDLLKKRILAPLKQFFSVNKEADPASTP